MSDSQSRAFQGRSSQSRLSLAVKALRELGPRQVGLYALYRLGLGTGYFRQQNPPRGRGLPAGDLVFHPPLPQPPDRQVLQAMLGEAGQERLLREADEIVNGQVRLFGGPPVPLQLCPPGAQVHWTDYRIEAGTGSDDIKWIWEPGRFGWAYHLARAYHLTGDERYPAAFWSLTEAFLNSNPPNLGPNWVSAQEVALRLLSFVFSLQAFSTSPHTTAERRQRLVQSIGEHAARIPTTLVYARAQNNNHLLTEALGLYTAGLALPEHPQGRRWLTLGWRWLNQALQAQIAPDGTYTQHSTNYHRLALQTAVWADTLRRREGRAWPAETSHRLSAATHWLLALLDRESGRVPNLGPNDGAYIFPLASCSFEDYRPVLQAAAVAFLDQRFFRPGPWDELAAWFRLDTPVIDLQVLEAVQRSLARVYPVLYSPEGEAWAYLRATRFVDRPGHADQLHLDLWWRGFNVAQDAGTYLYNTPPPWDNALKRTPVHNTVTVDGQDQMTSAGRFLYLDWAQARMVSRQRAEDGSWERLTAQHDGYLRLGVLHERSVESGRSRWTVTDRLLPAGKAPAPGDRHVLRLHWLLPDWPWDLDGTRLRLRSPHGWISLRLSAEAEAGQETMGIEIQLVRGGTLLAGAGPVDPTWGWVSPVYGYKEPALAFSLQVNARLPLTFLSQWSFPVQRKN